MKKLFVLFGVLSLMLFSCNSDFNDTAENTTVKMDKYNKIARDSKILIDEFWIANENNKTRSITVNNTNKNLLRTLLPIAKEFVNNINISHTDLESAGIHVNTEVEYENAIVSVLLLASELDYVNAGHNMISTRGGRFVDCFQEATGIAAGAALIGGLAAGTMSKKVILTLVARIGGKTFLRATSGFGLALIAAEIAYCMY